MENNEILNIDERQFICLLDVYQHCEVKQLYMYGRKVFGYEVDGYRVDVDGQYMTLEVNKLPSDWPW